MIPYDDRGLTLGDGLFETLLAIDGRLVGADAHLARMRAGCAVLDIQPPDDAAALAVMRDALRVGGLQVGRAAVRLTLTTGSGGRGLARPAHLAPRLFATAAPAPAPTTPARLVVSAVRRNPGSPTSRLKSLSYLDSVLARREAQAAAFDEALMLNSDALVACASAANLFWVQTGRLHTPALDCGVLAGTMRARVMGLAGELGIGVVETRATLADALAADALFLTNALIGVRAVSAVDDKVFGPSRLVERLAEVIA